MALYEKAAKQGWPLAENNLGWMYVKGKGVESNPKKGIAMLKSAANKDEKLAMLNLRWIYANGDGTKLDVEEAVRWTYKKDSLEAVIRDLKIPI